MRKTRDNLKENPKEPKVRTKVPKAYTRAKHRKRVSQVLKTRNRMQARTFKNLHQTYTTDSSWNDGWIGDEWNDGWSFDECNEDWSSVGWHEGWEQTCDVSASSFSLGGLDVSGTSSPKRFEWVKICRDSRYGQTETTCCCERKGPTAYSISFLIVYIKDIGFRRIFLKCDNEPSTKAVQDAVIHACVGVEDHMANGRVEVAVREVKRQCRTLRISAEQNTSVRIADDSPLGFLVLQCKS